MDGNNIIHAWPELADLRQKTGGRAARAELCRRLTSYQDISDFARVVVVFDGRGEKIETEHAPKEIQVFYSNDRRTADDVIERLVHKYAGDFALIVATNDVSEQDSVIAAGAEAMSAEALKEAVDRAEGDFRSKWL